MALSIEEYAIKFHKYHPVLVRFSANFLPGWVLQKAIPIIMKKESVASGRRAHEGQIQSKSRTPAFILLNRMYWGKGVLNKSGMHAGNNFDLSMSEGMSIFLHEAFHVYQFYKNPVKLFFQYLRAPIISVIKCGILWAHEVIDFEIEAIRFQKKMEKILKKEKYKNQLAEFKLIG